MTAEEWLATTDMRALGKAFPQPLSARKLVLSVCAYAARIETLVHAPELAELVRAAGAVADAPGFCATLLDQYVGLHRITGGQEPNGPGAGLCVSLYYSLRYALEPLPFVGNRTQQLLHAAVAQLTHPDPPHIWASCPSGQHSAGWWAAFRREEQAHRHRSRAGVTGVRLA